MNRSRLALLLAGLVLLTACGGGGGGGGTVLAIPTAVQEFALGGINYLVGSSGRIQSELPTYGTDEEAVLVAYSRSAAGSSYLYDLSGRIVPAAAPSLAPASPSDPEPALRAPEMAPFAGLDARMRRTEALASLSPRPRFAPSRSPAAPSRVPAVGENADFWALNSLGWPPSASDWTRVTATCRAIGAHCYLYEDDSVSGSYRKFPAEAWSQLQAAYDNDIYGKITTAFGEEPRPPADRDGDTKIYILFTSNVNRQSASGYFDSTNEMTQAEANQLGGGGSVYYSNEKEILFMQVPTTTFNWGSELRYHVSGVMAHEFTHMVVYNQHVMKGGADNEEDWLNEGLAQLGQDVAGYGIQQGTLSFVIEPFLLNPGGYSLTRFSFTLGQYGMSYLFARYLADQGLDPKRLVSTTLTGKANVAAVSGSRDFDTLFRDWCTALYLSNTGDSATAIHSFTTINLRAAQADGTVFTGPAWTREFNGFPFSATPSIQAYGVNFFHVAGGSGGTAEINLVERSGGNLGATLLRLMKR